MQSSDHNQYKIDQNSGKNKRIGIVQSLWNNDITQKMYSGCIDTLINHSVAPKDIKTLEVPGSFELIYGGKRLFKQYKPHAIILIGSIIKGETPHFNFISQAVANGVKDLNILFEIPFIFCVSTDLKKSQSLERAGGKLGNKGIEAAKTALHLIQSN